MFTSVAISVSLSNPNVWRVGETLNLFGRFFSREVLPCLTIPRSSPGDFRRRRPGPRHQRRHQCRHHRSHQSQHRSLRHPGRLQMARQGRRAQFAETATIDDVKQIAHPRRLHARHRPHQPHQKTGGHGQRPRRLPQDGIRRPRQHRRRRHRLLREPGLSAVKRAGGNIRVAHVPKTIDNDLPLPGSTPTFGFETARHHGVDIVAQPGRGRPHDRRAGTSSSAWDAPPAIWRSASARPPPPRSRSSPKSSASTPRANPTISPSSVLADIISARSSSASKTTRNMASSSSRRG